jgi:hypothetical protein
MATDVKEGRAVPSVCQTSIQWIFTPTFQRTGTHNALLRLRERHIQEIACGFPPLLGLALESRTRDPARHIFQCGNGILEEQSR